MYHFTVMPSSSCVQPKEILYILNCALGVVCGRETRRQAKEPSSSIDRDIYKSPVSSGCSVWHYNWTYCDFWWPYNCTFAMTNSWAGLDGIKTRKKKKMLKKRRTGKERRRSKKINCKSSPKAFNKLLSLGVDIMLWASINEGEINL